MRPLKKIIKNYDRRQRGYEATLKSLDAKSRTGYRRPGSKNPRKVGR